MEGTRAIAALSILPPDGVACPGKAANRRLGQIPAVVIGDGLGCLRSDRVCAQPTRQTLLQLSDLVLGQTRDQRAVLCA